MENLTSESYLQNRVEDQLNWLEKKSSLFQKRYKRIRLAIIVLSVSIPFASSYITDDTLILKIAVGLAGVLIALGEGLLSLNKYQELWVNYRGTAEALKREKYLFLSKAGVYRTEEGMEDISFPTFVDNVENILSTENKNWKSYVVRKSEIKKPKMVK